MNYKLTREPDISSCESLQWLIDNEPDDGKREIYLADLLHKSISLTPNGRNNFHAKGFSTFLPKRLQKMISSSLSKSTIRPIEDIDVAILTIKRPELLAAKIAFGVDLENANPHIEKGYHFYPGTFENRRDAPSSYSFILTAVGDDRNVPCSNCLRVLLSMYRPKIIVLVGMAAGNKTKVGLGDVVVAEAVIDVAGGRLEEGGAIPRPDTFAIVNLIRSQLTNYDENWNVLLKRSVSELQTREPFSALSSTWNPKFKPGVILSGEVLVADGSLERQRRERHDQAIALDMESSGFAQTCISENIPWIVFRGISDFGDKESKDGSVPNDPNRKSWQPYASLAAACIARDFLATRYRENTF